MHGRRVVITGATSGLGRATALALARQGASFILLSRNRNTGTSMVRQLARTRSGANATFIQTDLSSLSEVRFAATAIARLWDSVDILINNAGARFDTFGCTCDGLERTFATNHLGHFLLTCLLLPQLVHAAEVRIITVGSSVHATARPGEPWYFEASNYDCKRAYARSKLANITFALELASRLRGTRVTSNAIDPGIPATRFARNNGLAAWLKHLAYHAAKGQLVSAARGAQTVVYAATDREARPFSGRYFRDKRPVETAPAAIDGRAAADLWNLSATMTGLDQSLDSLWPRMRPETRTQAILGA